MNKRHFLHLIFGYPVIEFIEERQDKCLVILINKFQDRELMAYHPLKVTHFLKNIII